jgi:hypothetical protein
MLNNTTTPITIEFAEKGIKPKISGFLNIESQCVDSLNDFILSYYQEIKIKSNSETPFKRTTTTLSKFNAQDIFNAIALFDKNGFVIEYKDSEISIYIIK